MTALKIALAQCLQTDSIEDNERIIFENIEKAAKENVNIICFPESQTAGYRVDIIAADAEVQADRLDDLHKRVAQRCGELGIACILGTETPVPDHPDTKPFNTALVIDEKGKILGTHHKTKLTPMDAVGYTPGTDIETFDICGVKVGIVICFEGFRFAESTAECVRQGARLVFHPQNNTTRPNDWKIPVHHSLITTRAAENTIWFASCNACHPDHQNCSSMVVQPDGQILAKAELKKEELIIADLDIDLATQAMYHFDIEGCADMLFSDTVSKDEYSSAT
ncbi:carbon-nitrogen hydrolase family protein, partial [bacterium AH-315-E10]|nr:carbon-nitrogen hydrolase family protein [bacterium AH-315-E10]